MKRINLAIIFAFFALSQTAISQTHKRIKINNSSQTNVNVLVDLGIDLRCGAYHNHNSLTVDIHQSKLNVLRQNNISYQVIIENLDTFYQENSNKNIFKAQQEFQTERAKTLAFRQGLTQRSSVALNTSDNYLQFIGSEEENWNLPLNYPDVTSASEVPMGGSLTVSQVENELDEMRAYSVSKGLNIVSVKQDAGDGKTTWGNPSGTITNNGLTYSGEGSAELRFDPQTVYYIRITGNESSTTEGAKPQVLYTSMIHSRELSSLMGNIYFMWYLIENYDCNPAIKELVDNNELYFIPIVNPDGLRWNEVNNPDGGGLQRKNLRPNTGSGNTRGVDVNRNFDYFWGNAGSGSDNIPNSNLYRGPSAFSEPESQIIKNFVESRNFKTAVWQHSFANSIPHPYGGNPTVISGREDEMQKWHEDMTRFNRYVSGATIFPPANGIADDWMLGGAPDGNGSIGARSNGMGSTPMRILATTPENGTSSEASGNGIGNSGFWPRRGEIVNIAKRMVRINLMNTYYGGRYAKFHDLTPSNLLCGQPSSNLTTDLTFGIERIGQTDGNFTLIITPIQNIQSVSSPILAINDLNVLNQTEVATSITLSSGIQPNERIIYKVQLVNSAGGIFYDVTYEKVYQPNVLFLDNPDSDLLTNWTTSGTWTAATASGAAYSGSRGIKVGGNNNNAYSNNSTRTITTANQYDFSVNPDYLIQFFTKWDLERNYDFVEVLASINGGTFQPLEGKYSKPAATNATTDHASNNDTQQSSSSSGIIYDGDLYDNWKMEEIVIDSQNNSFLLGQSNVRIQFRFRSDDNNVLENYSSTPTGFYFDDFRIIGLDIPCDPALEPNNIEVNNISFTTADVSWSNISGATYDLRYRENGSSTWTSISNISGPTQALFDLNNNTKYEVQVATRCSSIVSSFSESVKFTTLNLCVNTISTFPYSESFETALDSFTGDWIQNSDDDLDWTNNSGVTDSAGTGPNIASDGSRYLYIEASAPGNITPVRNAILNSSCFDLTGRENSTFTFDYHMFGLNTTNPTGSLSIEVSDNGSPFITVPNVDTTQDNPLNGQQQTSNGGAWRTQSADLSAYDGKIIRLRFVAITDGTFTSDISIDNLNFISNVATAGPTVITQNITVNLDASGNVTIAEDALNNGSTGTGTLTFNTDITSFTCVDLGANTVTLTVTDDDGSSTGTAIVTVVDTIAPIITCATNITVNIDPGLCSAIVAVPLPSASDNCATSFTFTATRFDNNGDEEIGLGINDPFPIGETTVVWATDDGINPATRCPILITVIDNQAPTITDVADVTIECDQSTAPANTGEATATDNCDTSVTVTFADDISIANQITRTWTTTDDAGLSANSVQVITINPGDTWFADTDNDTYGDPNNFIISCSQPVGFVSNNDDCDDTDANINPNTVWYIGVDADNDTFFGSTTSVTQCTSPGAGYSTIEPATPDCDDTDANRNPDAIDIPNNGIDEDCDGFDETTLDIDDDKIEIFSVSPNPFRDTIRIKIPSKFSGDTFSIVIYDLNGRRVFSETRRANNNQIRLNSLSRLEIAPCMIRITNTSTNSVFISKLIKY